VTQKRMIIQAPLLTGKKRRQQQVKHFVRDTLVQCANREMGCTTRLPVTYIKELGFENTMGMINDIVQPPTERLFFIDNENRASFKATDGAIHAAIQRWKHHAETLELYLKNGRNNNTHEWK